MPSGWGDLEDDPVGVMRIITSKMKAKKDPSRANIESELNHLIPLRVGLVRHGRPEPEFSTFRQELQDFLNGQVGKAGLMKYIDLCENYAMRGATDGFEAACGFRSVLQILNDDFVAWADIEISMLVEDVEYIDETLEEVSESAPPVREHEIPDWVPDSHWWWRAPKRQDMSEAERKALLEYDHFDGVSD